MEDGDSDMEEDSLEEGLLELALEPDPVRVWEGVIVSDRVLEIGVLDPDPVRVKEGLRVSDRV